MTIISTRPAGAQHDEFHLAIPDSSWQPVGDPDGPGGEHAQLLATITINGVPLHLNAHQVADDEMCLQRGVQQDEMLDRLADLAEPAGPWMTCDIGGWSYILFATPYSS